MKGILAEFFPVLLHPMHTPVQVWCGCIFGRTRWVAHQRTLVNMIEPSVTPCAMAMVPYVKLHQLTTFLIRACCVVVLVDPGGFANFASFSSLSPPVPSTLPPVLKPPGALLIAALLYDRSCDWMGRTCSVM